MALKTFNLDEQAYREFSTHCKKHGISMSKKVEGFIKDELAKINGNQKMETQVTNLKKDNLKVDHHSMTKYC